VSDPSGLREQDDEQPQPSLQRRRRRRVIVALTSGGVVLVAGVVITVAVVNHNAGTVSNDPGCKEFASQLAGFDPVPPTASTDYSAFASYYGGYNFPAAYGQGAAQNDQVIKAMMALKNASDTMESDATQDEVIDGVNPVPQSKVDADTLAFNRALAAVDHICNLS
jgi:hypothetical protein